MKENFALLLVGIIVTAICLIASAIRFLLPNSRIVSILFDNYGAVSNIKNMSKQELIKTGARNFVVSILLSIFFSLPLLIPPVENSTLLVIMMIFGIVLPFIILYLFGTGITLMLFGMFRKSSYVSPPRSN